MRFEAPSLKMLKGLNPVVILMQKHWEAPNDSNDSIFWRFWVGSPKIKKIEASQHFRSLGGLIH